MRDSSEGAPGLRERKKERTREALIDAAQEQFLGRGYDATTIDDIVAAVEVSRRTFFRYFAGKEEVALARVCEFEERFLDALVRRPPAEPPLLALRRAGDEVLRGLDREPDAGNREEFLRMRCFIDGTPVLLAASLRNAADLERRLAGEIARRQGVDPATDCRPALLVTLYHSVMRVTMDLWAGAGTAEGGHLLATLDETWEAMGALLAGGWTAGAVERRAQPVW